MNKVLCIDDSKLIRKIVSQAAEMLGFEVVEACNGEEGNLIFRGTLEKLS